MILTTLMKHQQDALDYLIAHGPQCALFMKFGLGKSLIALAYAEHIGAKKILVTSDKTNAIITWPEQVWTHTDYECVIRPQNRKDWEAINQAVQCCPMCTITNYDQLRGRLNEYKGIKWDLWIGDESSDFKDQRRRRSQALKSVVSNIRHRIILNGSPLTERMEDMFGQFLILNGGKYIGKTMTRFRSRFMQLSPTGYGWVPKRSAYTDMQRAVQPCSYWRMDVPEVKMPERHFHLVEVELTREQKHLDQTLREKFEVLLGDVDKEDGSSLIQLNNAASVFIKRIQLAGGTVKSDDGDYYYSIATHKMGALLHIIKDNTDTKIVVWHSYVAETTELQNNLLNANRSVYVYTGGSDVSVLTEFQYATKGVLLIRTSMCKGLNALADADIAVFYSNPLSYRDRCQALGRTQRMSSTTSDTHVFDITTKGGADEIVYHMLSQKRSLVLTAEGVRAILDRSAIYNGEGGR